MKAKIKTWDKMVEEYGLEIEREYMPHILVPGSYFKEMEDLVPEDRVLELYVNEFGSVRMEGTWEITPEMVEYVLDDTGNSKSPEKVFETIYRVSEIINLSGRSINVLSNGSIRIDSAYGPGDFRITENGTVLEQSYAGFIGHEEKVCYVKRYDNTRKTPVLMSEEMI